MKRRIENIAGVVKHALLKAGDDESPQAIIKGFLDCFEVLPHEQILIDDLLESPAPQNAAGDNWIIKKMEEKILQLQLIVETIGEEYILGNTKGIGDQIARYNKLELYKPLPSPPSATAEQDKNITE